MSWQGLPTLCTAQQVLHGDKEFLLASKSAYIHIDSAYPLITRDGGSWMDAEGLANGTCLDKSFLYV